jgi:hypothetical protein
MSAASARHASTVESPASPSSSSSLSSPPASVAVPIQAMPSRGRSISRQAPVRAGSRTSSRGR